VINACTWALRQERCQDKGGRTFENMLTVTHEGMQLTANSHSTPARISHWRTLDPLSAMDQTMVPGLYLFRPVGTSARVVDSVF
jgi:hypothetical protein